LWELGFDPNQIGTIFCMYRDGENHHEKIFVGI